MYPTSYHPDGTGRDIGIYNHGTRTTGSAYHIGARDSTNVLPRLQKASKEKRETDGKFPSAAKSMMGTIDIKAHVERQGCDGPNFWSQSAYSSTYREHHSKTAAADFKTRNDDANAGSMVKTSTYGSHYRHGAPDPSLEQGLARMAAMAPSAAVEDVGGSPLSPLSANGSLGGFSGLRSPGPQSPHGGTFDESLLDGAAGTHNAT